MIEDSEGPLVEIHPCTEDGLVTLEARMELSKLFMAEKDPVDPHEMCLFISSVPFFEDVKCSEDLGYAIARWGERRIHVWRAGKITIRRARDRDDALKTMKLVSRALWPSIRCSCSKPLSYCFSGACEACSSSVCSAQLNPPLEVRPSPLVLTATEALRRAEGRKGVKALSDAIESLRRGVQLVKDENRSQEARQEITRAKESAMVFLLETERGLDAILGLLIWMLADHVEAILRIFDEGHPEGPDATELKHARRMALESIALGSRSSLSSEDLWRTCMELAGSAKTQEGAHAITCMAERAVLCMKLLSKPVAIQA